VARKRYSPKGWPSDSRPNEDLEQQEKKRGRGRESVVVPGRSQGPLSGADHYRFKEAIDGFEDQSSEIPELGDKDRILDRVVDEFGVVYLALRVRDDQTEDERWTYIRMPSDENPDFEVPDGGGIVVGGRPVERPIDIGGGSFTVPSGEEGRRSTQTIAAFCETILEFANTGSPLAYRSVRIPQGYSGGQIAARFYFYTSAAGSGNAKFDIRVRSVTKDESPGVMLAFESGATTAVSATDTLYGQEFTSYFDVQSSPGRGDEWQIEMQRDNTVGSNYANTLWLSGVQIVYPKDRATDRE
jgi:hypothetical protein